MAKKATARTRTLAKRQLSEERWPPFRAAIQARQLLRTCFGLSSGIPCAQGGVREHGFVPKGRKGEWREVNTSDDLIDCGTRYVLCVFRAPYVRTALSDGPMVARAWGTVCIQCGGPMEAAVYTSSINKSGPRDVVDHAAAQEQAGSANAGSRTRSQARRLDRCLCLIMHMEKIRVRSLHLKLQW